ncbi:YIP1 family protein [Fictibacillus enclensis]|nr:YIP1 family protein [Fictibacillus enclensis]
MMEKKEEVEGDHALPGEVHLLKSLVRPREQFGYFRRFNQTEGFFLRFLMICIVSALITAISYFLSSDHLLDMPIVEDVHLTENKLEASKYLLFVAGLIIGLVKPVIAVAFMAIVFLPFFRDVGFNKLFILQSVVYCVFMISAVFKLPFQGFLNTDEVWSPFSLGVAANYFSNNAFLISVLAFLSVFTVWAFYLTYSGLKQASYKSKTYIFAAVSLLYIGFMLLSSITHALQYGQLTL